MKTILEERHGPLQKVNAAAAEQALKTATGKISVNINKHALINHEDINLLKLEQYKKHSKNRYLLIPLHLRTNTIVLVTPYYILHWIMKPSAV